MLRAVGDRELAREAARVNVSALAAGQPRIVEREARSGIEALRDAVVRGRGDLDAIRRAVTTLANRAPTRLPPVRSRDVGPER
jgi:hypothetical protein